MGRKESKNNKKNHQWLCWHTQNMKDDESSDQSSQTMSACVNSDVTHMR